MNYLDCWHFEAVAGSMGPIVAYRAEGAVDEVQVVVRASSRASPSCVIGHRRAIRTAPSFSASQVLPADALRSRTIASATMSGWRTSIRLQRGLENGVCSSSRAAI